MEAGKIKNGMISLSYPMLSGANYTAWAMKMKVNLQAHEVWDAISSKDPKPTMVEEKEDKAIWQPGYYDIVRDGGVVEASRRASEGIDRHRRGSGETSTQRTRGKEGVRSSRDKSKVRCFNCLAYGHYAIECRKPKRDKDVKEDAHMAQIPDEEPTHLLAELKENEKKYTDVKETMQGAHEVSENHEDEDSTCVQSSSISEYGSETDEPTLNFKTLSKIYTDTEPIELEEDELYLMGIDEPVN
ncbi:hypothetical protein AgCh_000990 [Apium graveolens]